MNNKNLKLTQALDIENFQEAYSEDVNDKQYFGFPSAPIVDAENRLMSKEKKSVAYFSMEYGLGPSFYNTFLRKKPTDKDNMVFENTVFSTMNFIDYIFEIKQNRLLDMPIYSGGLGVLAGDALKSAADMGLSFAGIGILWNKGYFKQNFWFKFGQVPEEMQWAPSTYPGLVPLKDIVKIDFKNDTLYLRLWKYFVYSHNKSYAVPLILLDSNIDKNKDKWRNLTDQLYRSDDPWWKICQRAILGIGGVKALEKLGYSIDTYHLNEGHAAMAFLEKVKGCDDKKINALKKQFTYTCHTPVQAGHDRFKVSDISGMMKAEDVNILKKYGLEDDTINLTRLAMQVCEHANGVSKKHGQVTRIQFPEFKDKIDFITNGVHTFTWLSEPFVKLFDKYKKDIGNWGEDVCLIKNVVKLKDNKAFRKDLWLAHQKNKEALCSLFFNWRLDENIFTVCWARRFAGYKRPSLIFYDIDKLVDIAKTKGKIQILIAGKAHPQDSLGSTKINEIMDKIDSLDGNEFVKIIMLENYDMYYAKLLAASVDVWLNNPLPPFEASGTSGMKAILNGVLQMSTCDGWICEAKDNIGWFFGYKHTGDSIGNEADLKLEDDSNKLYKALSESAGLYYKTNKDGRLDENSEWLDKMIYAISEASFFNTDRMIMDYCKKLWGL